MGDVKGMMKAFQEALPMDKAPELAQRLSEGKFTLRYVCIWYYIVLYLHISIHPSSYLSDLHNRDMYDQLQNILKMGPLGKVMEMMPGMNQFLPQLKGNEGNAKIKIMLNILDSMTDDGMLHDEYNTAVRYTLDRINILHIENNTNNQLFPLSLQ